MPLKIKEYNFFGDILNQNINLLEGVYSVCVLCYIKYEFIKRTNTFDPFQTSLERDWTEGVKEKLNTKDVTLVKMIVSCVENT